MNFEYFFAKKIIKGGTHSYSKPIIRISILAIALGIAMMTLSLTIVEGFQTEIQKKISGFGAHIAISNYQSRGMIESKPISRKGEYLGEIRKMENVRNIQSFTYKGGILKANDQNQAILIKGVSADYQWDFFKGYLKEGDLLSLDNANKSNQVMLSTNIAKKMGLKVGDDILIYFVQQPPRFRKFKISGLYKTGLGEMDDKVILADQRHLQKINGWSDNEVGGIEIMLHDFSKIDQDVEKIDKLIDYDLDATSIKESRVDIFNWLELQDVNVIIIVGLLILVCGIDIISALLILILEKTNMIGILKALGSSDKSIRTIFIYNAAYLIIAGLILGNVFGLGFAFLQMEFGFLRLPQEAYFIDQVPIQFNFLKLALLNAGTLLICILMLIIPSNLVARIEPVKAIRFQ